MIESRDTPDQLEPPPVDSQSRPWCPGPPVIASGEKIITGPTLKTLDLNSQKFESVTRRLVFIFPAAVSETLVKLPRLTGIGLKRVLDGFHVEYVSGIRRSLIVNPAWQMGKVGGLFELRAGPLLGRVAIWYMKKRPNCANSFTCCAVSSRAAGTGNCVIWIVSFR